MMILYVTAGLMAAMSLVAMGLYRAKPVAVKQTGKK
jgi:hypothetical protein